MMRPLPSSSEGACSYADGHAPIFRPTGSSSLEHFPEDSYSSIRKLSEGLRRVMRGRERYSQDENLDARTQEKRPFHPHSGRGCCLLRRDPGVSSSPIPLGSCGAVLLSLIAPGGILRPRVVPITLEAIPMSSCSIGPSRLSS